MVDGAAAGDSTALVAAYGRYVDARSATVLVGAGLSLSSGYPSWPELLEPLASELGIRVIDDLPQLAQYVVDNVEDGRSHLERHVRKSFAAVEEPQPSLAYQLLAQLPLDEYWTTNYEHLLEDAISEPTVFSKDEELATIRSPTGKRVYQMHGSIDRDAPIVITKGDYESYPLTHPRFWSLLQAQFLTKSFLFIGFSFTDPNLELIFRMVRLNAASVHREHFAVMKRPIAIEGKLLNHDQRLFDLRVNELSNVGVKVVVIDQFEEIDNILSSLRGRCRPPQVMVSGSAPSENRLVDGVDGYPTREIPESVTSVALAIGERFASTSISVLSAGMVGATVGYELMRSLNASGAYEPWRFTLVRRVREAQLDEPNTRFGQIVFTGDDPTDLRSAVLSEVRALLVLGGGAGTRDEIARARAGGLGVVPVACTGGAARECWDDLSQDLGSQRLGGQPIEPLVFQGLANDDVGIVAEAAVRLVMQALFLEPEEKRGTVTSLA